MREEVFLWPQFSRRLFQRVVDCQPELQWHKRISLISQLGCCRATLSSSLTKVVGSEYVTRTNGNNPCKLGTLCNFFKTTLLYTWSYAPMPSIDKTVVIGFGPRNLCPPASKGRTEMKRMLLRLPSRIGGPSFSPRFFFDGEGAFSTQESHT